MSSVAKATKATKAINQTSQTIDIKTTHRASRYFVIGVILAVFNYCSYAVLANLIINNNGLLWLSSLIASALTTILAYILHSKITWKERDPGKIGIYKFLIWNILLTVAINPGFTQLFSLITGLYDFAYQISTNLGLPFSYTFIQSTGAFVFTAIVTMILNFLFYDKFVFEKPSQSSQSQKN